MAAEIIDSQKIAEKIRKDLKGQIRNSNIKPGLAVIQLGNNPASNIYLKKKEEACRELGIYYEKYKLGEKAGIDEFLNLISKLNQRKDIHGILVQLPLPEHLDKNLIFDSILPSKDVDGFHPLNIGNLVTGRAVIMPCTAKGVMKLIESTGEKIEGKNAVIIGRSNIVGKPVAMALLNKNATVTICHSKTRDLKEITKKADILVVAVGKPEFVKENMVKEEAIVIDVGITKTAEGIKGDVDFDNVKKKAGYITTVPGGVGPMTVTMLLVNTFDAAQQQIGG